MIDDTENHKRDCLARWVCGLPTLKQRRAFIDRFERRNGKATADDIRNRVQAQWRARRGVEQEEMP